MKKILLFTILGIALVGCTPQQDIKFDGFDIDLEAILGAGGTFPDSLPSYTTVGPNSPLVGHATDHNSLHDDATALATKLGTGSSPASSASNGDVLTADGSGGSSWSAAASAGSSALGDNSDVSTTTATYLSMLALQADGTYDSIATSTFNINTDNTVEGSTNLYYTQARWDTDFSATTTWAHFTTNFNSLYNATTTFGGNADTATALAANGANCAAGSYALGVDASGAAESCTDATTEIDSAISTHAGVATAHQALVTLAGTPDYLTLSGQEITRGTIDISDDTNAAVTSPITLTGDTFGFDYSTNNIWTGTQDFEGTYASTTGYMVIGTGLGALVPSAGDLFVSNDARISSGLYASSTSYFQTISDLGLRIFEETGGEFGDIYVDSTGDLVLDPGSAVDQVIIEGNDFYNSEVTRSWYMEGTATGDKDNPTYGFNADTNTGMFSKDHILGFSANGTEIFDMSSTYASTTGFLSIGTGKGTLVPSAGDLFVSNNATTTGDLAIEGGDLNSAGTALNIWGLITAKVGAIIDSVLQIPNGAGGTTVDAAGEITVDTTSDTLNFYDGTREVVLNPVICNTGNIASATTTDEALRIGKFFTTAVTITEVTVGYACDDSVAGGCSSGMTWNMKHGTDISTDGTTNNLFTSDETMTNNASTTPESYTSFNDATVPANSHFWLNMVTASTTQMTNLFVDICYRQDA